MQFERSNNASHSVVAAICLLSSLLTAAPVFSEPVSSTRIIIATGTAHLAGITGALMGGEAEIKTLIPAGMCPGHYDLRPSDIEALSNSRMVVLHTWQKGQDNIQRALEAARTPADRILYVKSEGCWMVPETQAGAALMVAEVLIAAMPDQKKAIVEKANAYVELVRKTGAEQQARLSQAGLKGIKVSSNVMIADLCRWAGLEVVETFGRTEDASVAAVNDMVRRTREQGVRIIVENLQSGSPNLSATVAQNSGAKQVILSNFPGGFDPGANWADTLRENVDRLIAARLVDR